ncbi:MAG TPA: hypothetical protein VFT06_08875 [Flavisolibacter sp.]|nr:hypothetical protein [Flavisolibacter sp.]
MNNRTLGILGLIGAPFLLIDTANNGFTLNQSSGISGLLNFLYTTGWMCSLIALNRMGAFGEKRFGKILFWVQMACLLLADCWNIYEWIQPRAETTLYFILDAFWPIGNLCMLVSGITIAAQGVLKGWRRYVPLAVGLWLPLGLVLWAIFSRTPGMLLIAGIYSALAWSLMAIGIITGADKAGEQQQPSSQKGPAQVRPSLQETVY